MSIAAAATSMPKACWAKGASQVSWKPKRPWVTDSKKPARSRGRSRRR